MFVNNFNIYYIVSLTYKHVHVYYVVCKLHSHMFVLFLEHEVKHLFLPERTMDPRLLNSQRKRKVKAM